jgi:hypothetical protein
MSRTPTPSIVYSSAKISGPKIAGMTPITVRAAPLARMLVPTIGGVRPYRSRHNRSLINMTGSAPGRSWPSRKPRPVQKTQEEEAAWLAAASENDCEAILEHPSIPGRQCSAAQALVQVCMHSHGHRAQLAKLFRRHEIVPPQTDFILWLTNRPEPAWNVE